MRRRQFLKNTLGGALTLAAANLPGLAMGQETSDTSRPRRMSGGRASSSSTKLRGVNLGGWLVLERWMVPDVYRDTDAPDEYSLCLTLGAEKARTRLNQHRETFITASDFTWIKNCGLNAVRLPVGYWALEAPAPYIDSWHFIDFALDQCQKNGLKLLLDLHGAPGSQNGWDHSGRSGAINWTNPQNVKETIRILESLAQKYGGHPALFGIELLNEPKDEVPLAILQQFYQDAYTQMRKHLDNSVAIVFHDSFRALSWKKFMQEPAFTNVILDTHLYQCFDNKAKARTALEQLTFAIDRKATLDEMQRDELPTIVGEWSLSLPGHSMSGLSPFQVESVTRAYADTQLLTFESTRGWFFWSYKLQHDSEWNFRHCVERGWLPGNFAV